MTKNEDARSALGEVTISAPDGRWPAFFNAEKQRLLPILGASGERLQHYGSTAVPKMRAKPIIDMMAPIDSLPVQPKLARLLVKAGYRAVDAGFFKRAFFRRPSRCGEPAFHLHLVLSPSWPLKNELLLRDWLIANPDIAEAYEALKCELSTRHGDDMPRYTAGKSAFIRAAVNDARAQIGLPPETDWNE